LRDLLRRSVLHAADGASPDGVPQALRAAGRVLAAIAPVRRRARYGLPDVLGTRGGGAERCLEVGPGRGVTLGQLHRLGWDAVGLDIDPAAARTARAVSGCEVRVGRLSGVDFAPGSFDMVYMNHVLEHLPDTRPSLRRCHELLAPGGRLVLVFPNPGSLGGRCDGGYAPIWDPPRHLVLPSLVGVVGALRDFGFRAVRARSLARSAAHYRAVARGYRRGTRPGQGFDARVRPVDRAFAAAEAVLTAFGLAVGEELLVVAHA
jgi:2-polyprenyl-3-methyl-5-hydroxy-6-metoxy-1,4-benzoquinol methylase